MDTFTLELKNVTLEVPDESKKTNYVKYLRLVNGVCAKFTSGRLSVVMGASGSSKTQLIKTIAGNVAESSKTYGEILFRGKERVLEQWMAQMAYLEQDDVIPQRQTVRECIEFAIRCRGSTGKSARRVEDVSEEIMKNLEIYELRNEDVGFISGGERKRVMFACEFCVGADVLILDELTSGLDSNLALKVVKMVKDYVVNENKIAIMIVHQPGVALFEMFDDILLMSKGSAVYNGPADGCKAFFESKGIVLRENISISELLLELFSKETVIESLKIQQRMAERISEDAYKEGLRRTADAKLRSENCLALKKNLSASNIIPILKRRFIQDWRSWRILKRLVFESAYYLFFAKFLIYELFRYNLNNSKQTDLCWFVFFKLFFPMFACIGVFVTSELLDSQKVVLLDVRKGRYGALSLYLSMFLNEVPFGIMRGAMFLGSLHTIGLMNGVHVPYSIINCIVGIPTFILIGMFSKAVTIQSKLLESFFKGIYFMCNIFMSDFIVSTAILALKWSGGQSSIRKNFLRIRHGLFFLWPYIFFELFISVKMLDKAAQNESLSRFLVYGITSFFVEDSALRLEFFRNFDIPNPNSPDTKLDGLRKGLDILYVKPRKNILISSDYPDYILMVLFVSGLSMLIAASIVIIERRFGSRMRLRLQ